MIKHNKPSIVKYNIQCFRDFWKKRNIELNPEKNKHGWRMAFRFINEDCQFKSNNYVACTDIEAWYNCACYVACFLKDDESIDENTYNAYCEELRRLFNNQCYS